MINDVKAAELVARFESAVLDAAHIFTAYRAAQSVDGTEAEQTALFASLQSANLKRAEYRLALLEALSGDRSGDEDPNNVWKGAETPFAENH
jgi:hypothetical protein